MISQDLVNNRSSCGFIIVSTVFLSIAATFYFRSRDEEQSLFHFVFRKTHFDFWSEIWVWLAPNLTGWRVERFPGLERDATKIVCLINQPNRRRRKVWKGTRPPAGQAAATPTTITTLRKIFAAKSKSWNEKIVFFAGNEIWFETVQSCSRELQGTARWLESERQSKDLRFASQYEQTKLDFLEPSRPMQISRELLR